MNIDDANYISFHNFEVKENLPLVLQLLSIAGLKVKQTTSTKFLGAQIDKNINGNNKSI